MNVKQRQTKTAPNRAERRRTQREHAGILALLREASETGKISLGTIGAIQRQRRLVSTAAQAYAQLGLRPISTMGKAANRKYKEATSEPAKVAKLFNEQRSLVNVAIVTGKVVFGFEADPTHGGDKALAQLVKQHGALPPTWESESGGSGGPHYFYACPDDFTVHSSQGEIGHGIDVRGFNGLMVEWPSIHQTTGRRYRWKRGYSPWEIALAKAPDWLLDWLRQHADRIEHRKPASSTSGRLDMTLIDADVPEGARDEQLFLYACFLRGQNRPQEEAEKLVLKAAGRCKPPFPEADALKKVEQAWRYPPGEVPAQIDTDARGDQSTLHDVGNKFRMLKAYGERVRRCEPTKAWLLWDDTHWKTDRTCEVYELAEAVVRKIGDETVSGEEKKKALFRHYVTSNNSGRIDAMLKLLRSKVSVTPEQLDTHPYLLNFRNGMVDLRTGKLLPHDPKLLITRLIPIPYDPKAKAPRFEQALSDTFDSDKKMMGYFHRAIGYSASGKQMEKAAFFCHGAGDNGKGTLIQEAIYHALGDADADGYAATVDPQVVLDVKHGHDVRSAKAQLKGVRFAAHASFLAPVQQPAYRARGFARDLGTDQVGAVRRDLQRPSQQERPDWTGRQADGQDPEGRPAAGTRGCLRVDSQRRDAVLQGL